MKHVAIAVIATFLFASCGNSPEGTTTIEVPKEESKTEETAKPVAGAKIDPVCEMEYDTSWTDNTVYKNDTVWFCSETCKTAFNGNPEKYAAKLH